MATLGKNAKGCRQMTLLEAGLEPTAELAQIECAETRQYWRRRVDAMKVRLPDFVVVLDDERKRVQA